MPGRTVTLDSSQLADSPAARVMLEDFLKGCE